MNIREHEAWFAIGGGSNAVKGFITPQSAEVLAALLTVQLDQQIRGSLVEIGTYMGKTFVGLAKAARKDEMTIGFDLFPDHVENEFKQSLQHLTQDQRSRVMAQRRNTVELPTSEWIRILNKPARFVHIDGGHNYAAIISTYILSRHFWPIMRL